LLPQPHAKAKGSSSVDVGALPPELAAKFGNKVTQAAPAPEQQAAAQPHPAKSSSAVAPSAAPDVAHAKPAPALPQEHLQNLPPALRAKFGGK
jgi:hypothetical protein